MSPAPSTGRSESTCGQPPAGRRSRRVRVAAVTAGLLAAALTAGAATWLHGRAGGQLLRPTGTPPSVSTSLAYELQLSAVRPTAAPGFTLTDQYGRQVSLASFRGRTVVLTFMDPHCTDICPIVSREFVGAYQRLGTRASRVAFVAVNVNPFHRLVADVAGFSREQRLDSIGSWYFLTGSLRSLRRVWDAYQVSVTAPGRDADVIHTSLIYFVDSHGRERYVAAPMADHTKQGAAFLPGSQLASWARGIALVARYVSQPVSG
ncbi:MAG TPA: SCO family protein [Streptosporangiaceae bacterium]|nr:SCO family protein [Streptosporangiaceae bacterium]